MICEPPNELQNMNGIELYLLEMFLDYEASQVKIMILLWKYASMI